MSGHKRATITISQEEYQRLHESELNMRFLKKGSIQSGQEIAQQTLIDLSENINQFEDRQNHYERLISGFEEEIGNIENSYNQTLSEIESNLFQQISIEAGNLWNHTNLTVQKQNESFSKAIQKLELQNNSRLNEIREDIHAIYKKSHQEFMAATEWLNASEEIAKFIDETYPHERFSPEKLEQIYSKLQIVRQNIDHNFLEAALSQAQQTFLELSSYRLQLENWQQNWFFLKQSALERAKALFSSLKENQNVQALNLDGQALDYVIDIDFWSSRKFSRFAQRIRALIENLEHPENTFDTNQLSSLLESDLPALESEFENLLKNARLNALNSQLRVNIADLVIQALEEQGFLLENSTYLNDDQRGEFVAEMKNIEGNQVVIQVVPNNPETCENELLLHSYALNIPSEYELIQRSKEVKNSLIKFGMRVGAMQPFNEKDYIKSGRGVKISYPTQNPLRQKYHGQQ